MIDARPRMSLNPSRVMLSLTSLLQTKSKPPYGSLNDQIREEGDLPDLDSSGMNVAFHLLYSLQTNVRKDVTWAM